MACQLGKGIPKKKESKEENEKEKPKSVHIVIFFPTSWLIKR
jgi:hypothetical protein